MLASLPAHQRRSHSRLDVVEHTLMRSGARRELYFGDACRLHVQTNILVRKCAKSNAMRAQHALVLYGLHVGASAIDICVTRRQSHWWLGVGGGQIEHDWRRRNDAFS